MTIKPGFHSLTLAAGLLLIAELSSTGTSAQEWPLTDDPDISGLPNQVEVEKKPGGRLNIMNTELEKRGGARSFPSFQPYGGAYDATDEFREKRPGGRAMNYIDEHVLHKRPGARFVAPAGGLEKRPGGRYYYGLPNRDKRPGGRFYGYRDDAWKRMGGRYSGRWKRAGGRHIGNRYNSFYGSYGNANRRYRWKNIGSV